MLNIHKHPCSYGFPMVSTPAGLKPPVFFAHPHLPTQHGFGFEVSRQLQGAFQLRAAAKQVEHPAKNEGNPMKSQKKNDWERIGKRLGKDW